MDEAFARTPEEVLAYFNVDANAGLSDADVEQAQKKYGRNELTADEGTPLWKLVLRQFDDLLVKILIVAAVVSFIIALSNGESFFKSLVEPSVIILILIVNATVGVITEQNAEKAIEELRAYEAESATVVRNGHLMVVAAAELVPGDIVEVAVGNKVPSDIRLIKLFSSTLRADQSILTGESQTVEKHLERVEELKAVYQDKTNILFSGTMVTSGRGRGVVVATGASTAIGKIKDAMTDQEEVVTPLRAKLDEFGALLSKIIAVICVLVWLMNINRFKDPALGGWFQGAIYYFKIAVALAVAAIPEGLPAVVTTCLALGTRKMAAQNAIVRTLPSVETLGCTTVIASDKTGTLTTNQMSVTRIAVLQSANATLAQFEVTGTTFSSEGDVVGPGGMVLRQPADSPCLMYAALASSLCNDSALIYVPETGQQQRVGESSELALRVFAEKVGLPSGYSLEGEDGVEPGGASRTLGAPCNAHWQARYARLATNEFSRDRKMMSVLVTGEGRNLLLAKGAPESVLQRCSSALANSGEGVVALSDAARRAVLEQMAAYGGRAALRCMALAFKPMPRGAQQISPSDEEGLTFIGMAAMHDPPRPECRAAIETCRAAGIRVLVVTGDNRATAEAVCRQVGALLPSELYEGAAAGVSFTGAEFDAMSAGEQAEAAARLCVMSRVEPLHKLKLVELLKLQGHVVAMTGDGVNDAPALVRADIGVAMGSGTAVAKQAADMVLADDNFATIVSAVREGRAIYANTKQFIRYMISSNIGEVVAIFTAALLGIPEVLNPVQLLWVNLVTDGLPATALGFNRPDKDIMTQRPRSITEPIVNGWLFLRYLIVGVYVGVATVGAFLWWYTSYENGPHVPWRDLCSFQRCVPAKSAARGYSCDVFTDLHPKTMAMTVLVVVEMFNALNNLSENSSLTTLPPWDNKWLLAAIGVSMLLHVLILYVSPLAVLFNVTHLDWLEWRAVLIFSAPVILVDETLKYFSRGLQQRKVRGKARPKFSDGGSTSGSSAERDRLLRSVEMSGDALLGSGKHR